MREEIISILKTYTINIDTINDFFVSQKLNNCRLDKVIKKITIYPNCDLDIIGVYPKTENNILVDYKLRLPKPDNLYNSLIYVHEIIHGLILENNLNTFFDENNIYEEILPMLYEDLFINYLYSRNIYNIIALYNKYTKLRSNDINVDEKYIIARLIINDLSYEIIDNQNIKIKMIKNNYNFYNKKND